MMKQPLYRAWYCMKQRCFNPRHDSWQYYGGRGITVCVEWLNYAAFAADMGPHPGIGWTLERRENDGNYSKNNCTWATMKTQIRHRRCSKLTMSQAAEIKSRREAGETGAALAKVFHISEPEVCRIYKGVDWA